MDKQELYNIIDGIDCCFIQVEHTNRTTRLLNAGFKMSGNLDGACATDVITELLEGVEQQLDSLHTKVDQYMLDNLE